MRTGIQALGPAKTLTPTLMGVRSLSTLARPVAVPWYEPPDWWVPMEMVSGSAALAAGGVSVFAAGFACSAVGGGGAAGAQAISRDRTTNQGGRTPVGRCMMTSPECM